MKAIITFHSIDSTGSVISFDPGKFARLVCWLAESSTPVCDLPTLLDRRTTRGISITFDDGMKSVYTLALPVLKEFGVRAHLFLTTGSIGQCNQWQSQPRNIPKMEMLNWNEVEACHEGGIHIEGHTVTHSDLRQLSDSEIENEFETADKVIKAHIGRSPAYFAYPYGYSNPRVRELARRRYRACVTTKLRTLTDDEDFSYLPRIDAYYLRSPLIYERLEGILARSYLWGRGALREIRGTQ